MATDPSWRRLPTLKVAVDADSRLVRQVLGAVVSSEEGEMAGHAYHRVTQTSPTEALVRFEISLLGRDLSTTERVVIDDSGLSFEQVSGYLGGVRERIAIAAEGDTTNLVYSGQYQPRDTLLGRLLGFVLVPIIYRREMGRTLRSTKSLAEARQVRSALFRRTG